MEISQFGHTIQLTGALYTDYKNHRNHLIFFPNTDEAKFEITVHDDKDIDYWNDLITQADSVETEIFQEDKSGKLVKITVRKCTRQISQQVVWEVYRRDQYTCRYCGDNQNPLTVDHIVLWEDGGQSVAKNLNTSCKPCNNIRGNMKYADWLRSIEYRKRTARLPDMIFDMNKEPLEYMDKLPRFKHKKGKR